MGTGCKSIKMGISTCSSQEGELLYMGDCMVSVCTGGLYGIGVYWGIVWYWCVLGDCMVLVCTGGLYGIGVYWGIVWYWCVLGDCMVLVCTD